MHTGYKHISFLVLHHHVSAIMTLSRGLCGQEVPQDFLTAFSWDVVSELSSQVILGHIAKAYHQDIWDLLISVVVIYVLPLSRHHI